MLRVRGFAKRQAMGEYNDALIDAGIMKERILGGLKPTCAAERKSA